jgi:hypothetical protein
MARLIPDPPSGSACFQLFRTGFAEFGFIKAAETFAEIAKHDLE